MLNVIKMMMVVKMCWYIHPDENRPDITLKVCHGEYIVYDGCCNDESFLMEYPDGTTSVICEPGGCVVDHVEKTEEGDKEIVCTDGRRVLEYCVVSINGKWL